MANHRQELRSRYDVLRRLYDDLRETTFARLDWHAEVLARRTLAQDERIEHWFLAEHFLVTWSNWRGLFDRFCRYFGQPADSFPKTWSQLIANCDVLVFRLTRDRNLDGIIARSWSDPDHSAFRPDSRRRYDIATIFSQIARAHERAEFLRRSEKLELRLPSKEVQIENLAADGKALAVTRMIVDEQNNGLVTRWFELPRRVQDQVWFHLRHYLHSTVVVSWLVDFAEPGVSALLSLSLRTQFMPRPIRRITFDRDASPPPASAVLERLLGRLETTIGELGYKAVVEDLISNDMIGGDDSLLASNQVTIIPGNMDDASRPILLGVTRGWNGKDSLSFPRVMRQVRTRLTEARGGIKHVVVFCDGWDSPAFDEEHREELEAHARQGVRFRFMLVGVPDRVLGALPVDLDRSSR